MGLRSRIDSLANGTLSARLDRLEGSQDTLEHDYWLQQRQLLSVQGGVREVAASREHLERQCRRLHDRIPLWEQEARHALARGREDHAREVLLRKHSTLVEVAGLESQVASLGDEEARLNSLQQRLVARIERVRTGESIRAEALSSISSELAELNRALRSAEDKTERLRSRAAALDGILDCEAVPQPGRMDALGQELRRLVSAQAVKAELLELKRRLGELGCGYALVERNPAGLR